MSLTITSDRPDGYVRLRLSGDLDMSTAPELTAAIDRVLGEGDLRILVDLRDLAFCDSTGLAAMVRGDNLAGADGGWLRVTGATGSVARVLRISGLAELLRYHQDQHDPAALGDR